jgi:chromosomal replication initiation ATPase DnaA
MGTPMATPARPDMDETGAARGQLAFELPHVPAQGEGDFLVGEGNALAHGRILAFPHWSEPLTLLIGPAASGKSHLARIFADRSGAHFAGVDELESLATRGGQRPLIVEDVDRLGYDEAGLFHLLNQSMRDQRAILLTAREEVAQWPLATDDVRSRARRATAFSLEMTDDIQLSQMFVKLFGDRQIKVDPRIIGYLVARMERSTEEVAILADLMDRLALAKGTAITRSIAADALDRRAVARGAVQHEQDWDGPDDE